MKNIFVGKIWGSLSSKAGWYLGFGYILVNMWGLKGDYDIGIFGSDLIGKVIENVKIDIDYEKYRS